MISVVIHQDDKCQLLTKFFSGPYAVMSVASHQDDKCQLLACPNIKY